MPLPSTIPELPSEPLSAPWRKVACAAQVVAAVILGQTLYFKFSAAPEFVTLVAGGGVTAGAISVPIQ